MSQKEIILKYLQDHGSISSMTAFTELGITRLSARVWDLRKDGYDIVAERINYKAKDGVSKHYDLYKLGVGS